MTKELPEWMKKSGLEQNSEELSKRNIRQSTESSHNKGWDDLQNDLLKHMALWDQLGLSEIFRDVAEYVFNRRFTIQRPEDMPGSVSIKDSENNHDWMGTGTRQRAISSKILELRQKGFQANELQVGSINADFWYEVSRGSGDDRYTDHEADYHLSMDVVSIKLRDSSNTVILDIPLSEVPNKETLQEKVDTFCVEVIRKQKIEKQLKNQVEEKQHKITEIYRNLQLTDFFRSHGNLKTYQTFVNTDTEIDLDAALKSWLGNEPAIQIKITIRESFQKEIKSEESKPILKVFKTKKQTTTNIQQVEYSLIFVTESGRIGIPLKNGSILERHANEFPSGGRGFRSKSQINRDLENLITPLIQEPQFTDRKEVRPVPYSGGW